MTEAIEGNQTFEVLGLNKILTDLGVKNNIAWANETKKKIGAEEIKIIQKEGSGTIYYFKTGSVIKEIGLCPFGMNSKICEAASTESIVYRSNILGGNICYCPGYISEMILRNYTTKLSQQGFIFGTEQSSKLGILQGKATLYALIENNLKPLEKPQDERNLAFVLCQIMITIFELQEKLAFVHYDLQWNNIKSRSTNGKYCVSSGGLNLKFTSNIIPIISNFGSSVFAIRNTFYANLSTDPPHVKFNKYYDGLTLLKSLETNLGISLSQIPTIVSCFVKNPLTIEDYYYGGLTEKPSLTLIEAHSDGLHAPFDIIQNLVQNFNLFGNEIKTCKKNILNFSGVDMPQSYFYKEGVQLKSEIDLVKRKTFNLNYTQIVNNKIDLRVVREVDVPNIFSFSLFIGNPGISAVYKYLYDPSFNILKDINPMRKDVYDAFYARYFKNQLTGCVELINNSGVGAGSKGEGLDQWADFGTLLMIDDVAMSLPMLISDDKPVNERTVGTYGFWNIKTGVIDTSQKTRIAVSELCFKYGSKSFTKLGFGTIKDYVIDYIDKNIPAEKLHRFGLYSYKFDNKYRVPFQVTDGTQTIIDVKDAMNTIGNLGSLVRYMVTQDSSFDVILFRDAHSTLPNRNYTYDREWYNTWITRTDKKYWFYHGAFYNAPHFHGAKSGFGATWAVRKEKGAEKIYTDVEYETLFKYTDIDEDMFYGQSGYGVDERVMYRLYGNKKEMEKAYLVGMTHLVYLFKGQENPRKYKVVEEHYYGENILPENDKTVVKPITIDRRKVAGKVIFVEQPVIANENVDTLTDILRKKGATVHQVPFDDVNFQIYLTIKNVTFVVNTNPKQFGSDIENDALKKNNLLSVDQARELYLYSDQVMCRKMDYVMPSHAFYVDMRCAFFFFAKAVFNVTKNPHFTLGQYFDALEVVLVQEKQEDYIKEFMRESVRMLPPRYNIWQYLFDDRAQINVDAISFDTYVSQNRDDLNVNSICSVNRKLWVGDLFDVDEYFWTNGIQKRADQIPIITLPDQYPRPPIDD